MEIKMKVPYTLFLIFATSSAVSIRKVNQNLEPFINFSSAVSPVSGITTDISSLTRSIGNVEFTYLSATELVENYLKDPNGLVEFRNISSSAHNCFALFSNGHSAGVHNMTGEYLMPDSGIMLSSGNVEDFNGQDSDNQSTDFKIKTGDEDLESQLPDDAGQIYDACFLQFEFRCPEETDIFTPAVNFDYVWASEEYFEYVFSAYNDAFGFFLNGNNIALVPNSSTPVTINTVNHALNDEYFIGNEIVGRDKNSSISPYMAIEADGFTSVLTAIATPKPGWNLIKLITGDVADGILDSWVLLEAGTFGCKERTKSPTPLPTSAPSTKIPTSLPTEKPVSSKPTNEPTEKPTAEPSQSPTSRPTSLPTNNPSTLSPTSTPTHVPSENPSKAPTFSPTTAPTSQPVTLSPTSDPSQAPSSFPSIIPTSSPSEPPSLPYPCGMLPCDRSRDLKKLYSTVSDLDLLNIPGTPQSLALDWITNHDLMQVCPNDSDTYHTIQRYVMAVFYFSTEGYQWKSCRAPKMYTCEEDIKNANDECNITLTSNESSNGVGMTQSDAWLTPSHECYWGGVCCHGINEPRVINCVDQIYFEANTLGGFIAKELDWLGNLQYIYVEEGIILEPIPTSIGSLVQIQVIDSQCHLAMEYHHPSISPTKDPITFPPTKQPTQEPTGNPSREPSVAPSSFPIYPTNSPSESPSWPYPCGMLPCDRSKDLKKLFSTVSDLDLLNIPGTPQSLALDWITNHDLMQVCPNDSDTYHTIQRYVMAVFYFSTEGYQWKSCRAPKLYTCEEDIKSANDKCNITLTPQESNIGVGISQSDAWLTPSHECYWGGIGCHGMKESQVINCVDQIDFEANNLGGYIPKELEWLRNLRYLYLEQGKMSGPIPTFIGSLVQLQVIDLNYNQLSGSIPSEIYGLKQLEQLDLDHNSFSGTLSSKIGLLSELKVLQLDHNALDGTIPSEIRHLKHLEVGFFSYNNFTGNVDEEICNLRFPAGNLEKLQVDCAAENGKVECTCCSSCHQTD